LPTRRVRCTVYLDVTLAWRLCNVSTEVWVGLAGNPLGDAALASGEDAGNQAIIDEVLSALQWRLADIDSPLLADVLTFQELSEQVRAILLDVLEFPEPGDAGRLLSVAVGTSRARKRIHPVESLRAAGELFDIALPIIAHRRGSNGREILDLSQRLHQSIMNRIVSAALPYVEFLLTKVHACGERERQRISRELHDRVGHGMALAMQHLDMFEYFSGIDSSRAEREFKAGQASLNEAFRTVRHLSTELRRSVGEAGLGAAIESYLRENVTGGIRSSAEFTGDEKLLSPPISEELYLIIREACRNALRHGQPSEIRLTMAITESEVTATVSDNGRGFTVGAPASPSAGGLLSMTERVELLDGILKVESAPGEGATVSVRVPLSGGRLP
jgi:signal transduction histidine kinase